MANRNNFFKLEILLLSILEESDCYGYQLAKSIQDQSNGLIKLGDGTMYNILYKLLDKGYISSYDKIFGKKIRVYYHLKPEGKIYLDQLVQEFHDFVLVVEKIISHQKESSDV